MMNFTTNNRKRRSNLPIKTFLQAFTKNQKMKSVNFSPNAETPNTTKKYSDVPRRKLNIFNPRSVPNTALKCNHKVTTARLEKWPVKNAFSHHWASPSTRLWPSSASPIRVLRYLYHSDQSASDSIQKKSRGNCHFARFRSKIFL